MKARTLSADAAKGQTSLAPPFPDSAEAITAEYVRGDAIFAQGDACDDVFYIQKGGVKLSVVSQTGREAITAILERGDFFGEGCLAGQPVRVGSATAIA